jgi:hypothetical protein
MDAVCSILRREGKSDREAIAVCEIAVAAVRHNMEQEEAERKAEKCRSVENGK